MKALSILTLSLMFSPCFAMADAAGGAPSTDTGAVVEIVTFHLAPGVTVPAFLTAAEATGPMLRRQTGFLGRSLGMDAMGLWTDIVIWQSRAHATAAASAVMQEHEFAPFLHAIDPASITLRHSVTRWQMDTQRQFDD